MTFGSLAPTDRPARAATVPLVFTAAIFLSAGLLFFVQPLFAKLALPHVGGAPAVWTTAMLFFQTVLLAGYLYAHLLTRRLPVRAQVGLHLALWAAALLALPLAVPEGWAYDPAGSTVAQTLGLFALGVGLPFAVLAANAPLIQAWYRRAGGPSADDPYFLYGASNLGSMLALLAFPLVAEPLFGATAIGRGWAAGFVALGALLLAAGALAARGAPAESPARAPRDATAPAAPAAAVTPGRIARWLLLAFVPSSLMLALTSKITTDIGALPLVWVVPLALYLVSFTLTFTNRPPVGSRATTLAFAAGLAILFAAFAGKVDVHRSPATIGLVVPAFFFVALYAHRRLYEARPDGGDLTLFYVAMSVGGALGGLFNSVLAPWAFDRLWEGPITLLVAAALPLAARPGPLPRAARRALAGYALAGAAGLAAISTLQPDELLRERSFFGAHRVKEVPGSDLRLYTNGTTVHGGQRLSQLDAERPLGVYYYHPEAPLAQVLTSSVGRSARRVGVLGLGVGGLACYRAQGQEWHYYEIDETVRRVARDAGLFTYLSACTPEAPVHMGDARIVLEGQPRMGFGVLVVDVFSSDYVPVHLMTREAIALYLDHLAPGGVLALHISNRYYDLALPLARAAEALDLEMRVQRYRPGDADPTNAPSSVALLARDAAALGPLAEDPAWRPRAGDGGPVWTDDYATPLGALR